MEAAQTLKHEDERLFELFRYQILDTEAEKDFDDLVELAALICETPISLISLIDKNRQWFKARKGMKESETIRDVSFCAHAIQPAQELIVKDASSDSRFSDNPLVTGDPNIRFYAGIPLITQRGFTLGTLCVIDRKPKELSKEQLATLRLLSNQVMKQLELRLKIIELNEAHQQITKKDRLYRLIAYNSKDVIVMMTSDEIPIYTFLSPSAKEVFGYEPEELIGKSPFDIIPEEDVAIIKKEIHPASLAGKTQVKENRIRKRDGSIIWTQFISGPAYDDHGEVIGIMATVRDISEQKKTEFKLVESERLYRLISTNSNDLISVFEATPEAKSIFVSPSAKAILGYEPEELIGTSPFDLMLPEEVLALKETAHQETLRGKASRTENRLRKKDGSYIWIEAFSQPIFDIQGKLVAFQSSGRDITERKKLEEQLKREKEKAEKATLAKSDFLSTMSHEIRTPMNAIIGLTNLMVEENPREDQIENLKLLKFSGENLLTIINDILDLSKVEAGKIELEVIAFNLREILTHYVTLLKGRALKKGIELNLSLHRSLPSVVLGDPVRFGQVLNNLIGNAIKFTEKGAVEVIASTLEKKEDVYRILLAVKDSGIGIAPDKMDAIFERFTQASSDISRRFGGTGLGLAITKKLLHLMGSEIKVHSEPGKGSEFSFEIEMKQVGEASISIPAKDKLATQPASLRVLLVDDNKVNQVVAGSFLKSWGMEVQFADHGREALEIVAEKKIDIVLMDLQMPEMDGYEASLAIRAFSDPYFKTLPILALTASALQEVKEKAFASGINGFITKPFQPDDLKQKILQSIPSNAENIPQQMLIQANIDQYTQGDAGLKRQLTRLIILNLHELKAALKSSLDEKKREVFAKAVHKSKTTLSILNDVAFTETVTKINQSFARSAEVSVSDQMEFHVAVEDLINGLEEEIKIL